MDLWIGPAIVAALVSATVSAIGWFVTSWQAARIEQRRRDEKVHDFQVALRAEIVTDLLAMQVADRAAFLASVTNEYANNPDYVPFVTRSATNVVFESVVGEIHILPGEVIEPVIRYAALRQTVDRFADDLRSYRFMELEAPRQLTMYSDYLATVDRLEALAERAKAALDQSLGVSSSDEGQPNPASASAPDEDVAAERVLERDGP